MQTTYQTDNFKITIDKQGDDRYTKTTYPIRSGTFTQIETDHYILTFNQLNAIKTIKGKSKKWGAANEWFKRTAGNDWTYYTSAGYKGTYSFIGEYYLPCFSYAPNPIFEVYGYDKQLIENALNDLSTLFKKINKAQNIPHNIQKTINSIASQNNPSTLEQKAKEFHAITSGIITVLPPDCRHADYDIIPINISEGCLYNCAFCSVKQGKKFKTYSQADILKKIDALKQHYGKEINNYGSIFLGEHDALNADQDIIINTARAAYQNLNLKDSYIKTRMLHLFGSVDSLINADQNLFSQINALPLYTYINIGMESADQETLKAIGKPITVEKVFHAFERMLNINQHYNNIEITANFLIGESLSDKHYQSIIQLTKENLKHPYGKGAFYFSPLQDGSSTRYIQQKFIQIKNSSFIQSYIYLIQRL